MLTSADYQHLGLEPGVQLLKAFYLEVPDFGFHWHYHPELEITYVRKGRGIRMVGDNVSPFEAGDFVFMGSNLPHTWISDDDFNRSNEMMEVAVLQFHPIVLEGPLLNIEESNKIRRLIAHANRGIAVGKEISETAGDLLFQMIDTDGIDRIIQLLKLLDLLGQQEAFSKLASPAYIPPLKVKVEKRILDVCRYVHEQFMHPIKLETVAHIANMNPTSFCRFFRKSTGQSLSEYIMDLRIGKASNLLLDKRDLSISEIAYASGFPSQTLFNRTFRKKKGLTPTQFKRLKQ